MVSTGGISHRRPGIYAAVPGNYTLDWVAAPVEPQMEHGMKLMVPVAAITILSSPVSSFAESSGQDLDLGKYHLTFDWEAESFDNSPWPGPGHWATTLSDGLRYLADGDQQCWTQPSVTTHSP
jgi:hypothetical protein